MSRLDDLCEEPGVLGRAANRIRAAASTGSQQALSHEQCCALADWINSLAAEPQGRIEGYVHPAVFEEAMEHRAEARSFSIPVNTYPQTIGDVRLTLLLPQTEPGEDILTDTALRTVTGEEWADDVAAHRAAERAEYEAHYQQEREAEREQERGHDDAEARRLDAIEATEEG